MLENNKNGEWDINYRYTAQKNVERKYFLKRRKKNTHKHKIA